VEEMIKFIVQNHTGILYLNRPEKRNALHPKMVNQIKEKLKEIEKDDDVKVLVITGEGKAFCAGADLEYLNELRDYSAIENEADSKSLAEMFLMIYNLPKPVIAAVQGAAIAGGCGLASVCDFIVAHPEDSKFGYSEVKIGFIPAIVSTFIIKRIGEGNASHLLLSGGIINGKRAYEINLANYLSYNVLETAIEVSYQLATYSLNSLSETKRMIKNISNMPVEKAVEYCLELNTISRSAEDFKTGLNNFLNKNGNE
jgi:methylglutaconyl-CoA hydratase